MRWERDYNRALRGDFGPTWKARAAQAADHGMTEEERLSWWATMRTPAHKTWPAATRQRIFIVVGGVLGALLGTGLGWLRWRLW